MQIKLNQIKILENIISVSYQEKIQEIILADQFPWFYNSGTIPHIHPLDTSQFIHKILYDGDCSNGNLYALILPLIYNFEESLKVKFTEHCRIKANLLIKRSATPHIHPPHTDKVNSGYISIVYYVNDSDGDTVLYNELENNIAIKESELQIIKKVKPKRGTAVAFPSNQYHSSSLPNTSDTRAVINFIFKI